MPDWTKTMQQTFEYYIVDPNTWRDEKRVDNVISSSITRDLTAETRGYANLTFTESPGECYIRIYLITIQNGIKERFPLGTYLIQTPSYSFNGIVKNISVDAYTPLLELKENMPPLGYSILKGSKVMDNVYKIMREQMRAPLITVSNSTKLDSDFTANINDTWLVFLTDLISKAKLEIQLDELSRIIFTPKQKTAALRPVWTYDDTNSSILYPDIEMSHDLYGIPNVVEVIYSEGVKCYHGIATNDNPNSPTSTVNRKRKITKRVNNPSLPGTPSQVVVQQYAEQLLLEASEIEYTISYKHGYCPVRIGDCVRLNYKKAGIYDVRAKVISQNIDCTPGCPVSEKASFTANLWKE